MARRHARPWHLLLIATIALLWHFASAVDQLMTWLRVEAYMRQFPEEWVAYFTAIPGWVNIAWAAGAWFGLLGSVLLMMRDRMAVLSLAAASLGMIIASVWFLALSSPLMPQVTGPEGLWVLLASCLIPLILWLYARRLKQSGVFS